MHNLQDIADKLYKSNRWLPVLLILLLVFAVILPHLGADAPWIDEAFTFRFSGLGQLEDISVVETTVLIAVYDPWPPLYYILQNIWDNLTGSSFFAINMLPAIYGIISIALMYQLGKKLFKTHIAGIIAATLLGSSLFFVYYLHETRGYSLFLMVWVLVLYAYWRFVTLQNANSSRNAHIALALSVTIALYTHYISIILLGGIIAYHILFEWRSTTRQPDMTKQRWISITRALVNGILLFTPWIAVIALQITSSGPLLEELPLIDLMATLINATTNGLWVLAIPLILLSLLRFRETSSRFLWVWTLIVLIGLLILNIQFEYLSHPRHIMPLVIALVLLLTRGVLIIGELNRSFAIGFVSLWLGMGLAHITAGTYFGFQPELIPRETFEAMAELTEACVTEDDIVVALLNPHEQRGTWMAALNLYYYADRDFVILPLIPFVTDQVPTSDLPEYLQPVDDESVIDSVSRATSKIYLLSRTDLINARYLLQFDEALRDYEFEVCEILPQNDALLARLYTTEDDCEQITSCI